MRVEASTGVGTSTIVPRSLAADTDPLSANADPGGRPPGSACPSPELINGVEARLPVTPPDGPPAAPPGPSTPHSPPAVPATPLTALGSPLAPPPARRRHGC